jgi:formate dehydrogenase major subunit
MPEQGTLCTVTVDKHIYTTPAGQPLTEFLRHYQHSLPSVCYHPTLGTLETCDSCWVEANGKLQRACTLNTEDGLEVKLKSPQAQKARREGVDRLIARHELYCTVCENNNGDCELQDAVQQAEIPYQRYSYEKTPYDIDDSHPFYRYDPDQCILCGRCVEACQNVQVTETLSIDWERDHPRVLWDGGEVADQSSCVSCGHCVTVCPCNALMEKSMLTEAGPLTALPQKVKRPAIELVKWVEPTIGFEPVFGLSEIDKSIREQEIKKTKTVCTYCGVGCAFDVWTKDRQLLKMQPREEAPVNGISTCVKGKFAWDFINADDRLTTPLIREHGRFREASWEEAYSLIARRFSEIKNQYGPDALMLVASSKCTNEDSYLMQKLARAVIGTNNIDNCSRYCQSPATTGLWRTMGYGGDGGSISDLAGAELILFLGSNTAESHPVLATRLKQAQKHRGQKHIVFDLRRHEMAERADYFFRPKPGTDLVWLSAISKYILDQGLEDKAFLTERVNGLEDYRQSLEPFDLDYAERECGIDRSDLVRVAEMLASATSVCAVWAMGVTQHVAGSDTSTAIANLLLITGNCGRPNTGAYPMRGHNNVQGCSDFGSMPSRLPGYEFVSDDHARQRYEDGWGVTLSTNKGYNNHTMLEGIRKGKLKSLYVVGEEMAMVEANAQAVQEDFNGIDFMVVQDIFFTRTCEHADVILPAAPSLEKEGTFTNTERRIQRLYPALEPLGEAKPDWLIHTELARALGADWSYQHPSEIMAEAAQLAPMFAGVRYDRLEGYASQQWPVQADGSDTPHLYLDEFPLPEGKAQLFPLDYTVPTEQADDEYDLHVNNGRLLESFHEGNLTHRSAGIRSQVPGPFIEVSPELAQQRGIESGSLLELSSPYGSIRLRALITDRVQGTEVFVPENSTKNSSSINILTSGKADKDSSTPAYKEIAAKLEIIEQKGEIPLPRENFRFWKSTPAPLATPLKWHRGDYLEPPESARHPEKC